MSSNYSNLNFTAQNRSYHPSPLHPPPSIDFSVPPPSFPIDPVQTKLHNFLHDRKLQVSVQYPKRQAKSSASISFLNINRELTDGKQLLNDLQCIEQQLEANSGDVKDHHWSQLVENAEKLKTQLRAFETKYSDPKLLQQIQKLHQQRQKKRLRIKKRNDLLKTKRTEALKQRKDEHQRIDQWQNKIMSQLQKEKAEEAEAVHARKVLADVTKKIADAQNYLDEFAALIELRRVREVALQASDLGENDFEAEIYRLEQVWQDALHEYKEEEGKLRSVLERRTVNSEKSIEKQWNNVLFGESIKMYDHPMLRAEKDFNEFLEIRKAWDICLVADHDETGSNIPSGGWVMPNSNPLPEWKKYRKED